jgi:hypothetical protein
MALQRPGAVSELALEEVVGFERLGKSNRLGAAEGGIVARIGLTVA